MLGRAPLADIIGHSAAFLPPLRSVTGPVVDLGSGGGVPGLVIAWMRPDLKVLLVDRRATRADHLLRLVHRLHRTDQVRIVATDAAALPRLLTERVAAVVARSFGPPERVLRAARPIIADDGVVVVSAPPEGSPERWPGGLLERHGFRRIESDRRVTVIRPTTDVPRETL